MYVERQFVNFDFKLILKFNAYLGMKIKNEKDVQDLEHKIKTELGIDVSHYKNNEVAEELVSLLIFPKYFANWVMRPVILALVIYALGFYVIELTGGQVLIFAVLGFVLFFTCGFLAGLLLLIRRIKKDILKITDYSLVVMKSSITDIGRVGSRMDETNKKDVLGLLFTGIIHIVTIPMLSEAMEEKIPFLGRFSKGIMKRSLVAIAEKIDFDVDKIDENKEIVSGDTNTISSYLITIETANKSTHRIIYLATRIFQIPLKIIFSLFFMILIFFIYLIW